MSHVTKTEFDDAIKEIKADLTDIRDNHLDSIYGIINALYDKVNTLKWVVVAGAGVISIVLAMLHLFA